VKGRHLLWGVCVGAFLFIGGLAVGRLSAQGVSADAGFWSAMNVSQRTQVVEGAIDAYVSGWVEGTSAEGARIDREVLVAADAHVLDASASLFVHDVVNQKDSNGRYRAFAHEPTYSKTFGAYAAQIDDFYARFPRSSGVTVGEVLTCLADEPIRSCRDQAVGGP